ncbi:MAG: NAD(P)-dependent oxidoreductase [Alphaproteobacteria bacterium]|jgi:UDP-glucose 4-epimerase|nr:NAD(P)-dependent oxidoreductase [Alphaproteobacteria bacterium]MBT7941979.1 NAD(P)-dependent oxidoreductase [Alphaproteobacteria bacterium]
MKKIVVFGGSGFLGSYVSDELSHRGNKVVVADINESPYLSDGQSFIACDIMDPATIENAVKGADVVYNFAGLANLDESINQPKKTMEQNVLGNINVLEACKNLNLERYVYASSAYAFSDKGSFYGISKLSSEKIIEEYAARFNLPYTIIRYGSLYGERADVNNGMYRLLRAALEDKKIVLKSDGEDIREYIHAHDAARLSADIIETEEYLNQHMVLSGVERLRHKDLLQMVQEILSDDIEITYMEEPREGHYQVTPYSYHPTLARKLVLNSFIELGQGMVSCIKKIHDELEEEKGE